MRVKASLQTVYCVNKILGLTKILCLNDWIVRFQNGCIKVVIERCVVQFYREIIIVIANRTRAARLLNFEITRMISGRIALHSVQIPLVILQMMKQMIPAIFSLKHFCGRNSSLKAFLNR